MLGWVIPYVFGIDFRPLWDLLNIKYLDYVKIDDDGTLYFYGFDKSKVKKVRPWTAARILADQVKGNSYPSKMERLRREFRRNERYYDLW